MKILKLKYSIHRMMNNNNFYKEPLVQKCTGGFLFYKLKFSIVFERRIVKMPLFKRN